MVANRTSITNTRVRVEQLEDGTDREFQEKEQMLIVCHSWQVVRFEPRPVVFVRITGTRNTANEVFHLVYFEAPACQPVGADQPSHIQSHQNVEYMIAGSHASMRRSNSQASIEANSSIGGASFGDSTNAAQSLPMPTACGMKV